MKEITNKEYYMEKERVVEKRKAKRTGSWTKREWKKCVIRKVKLVAVINCVCCKKPLRGEAATMTAKQ
jgi:hypothetical protein